MKLTIGFALLRLLIQAPNPYAALDESRLYWRQAKGYYALAVSQRNEDGVILPVMGPGGRQFMVGHFANRTEAEMECEKRNHGVDTYDWYEVTVVLEGSR